MSSPNKKKLLLIDDELDFLQAVAERSRPKDFNVVAASTGEEAVAAAENELFDGAVVDFQMPGMDGTQVLKALKDRHRHLEIIMLTGHATIDSALESTKLGAFKYLEKPYDFEILVTVIENAYQARMKKNSSTAKSIWKRFRSNCSHSVKKYQY